MLFCLRHALSVVSLLFVFLFAACEPPQVRYEIPPPYPEFSETEIPALPSGTPVRKFLIFGDWGGGDSWRPGSEDRQVEVANGMSTLVQRRSRGVDYAIMTGDNFYTKGVSSINDRKWVNRFENVYDEQRFPFTFYAALGNHDYGKNPQAQVEYHRLKNETATGRWYMPARYYTFSDTLADETTIEFFALDTQILLEEGWYKDYQKRSGDPPGASEKHLAWLTEQLAASRADWKIAYMHHPVFSNGRHGDAAWLIENVKPLFERYGVQAVFAGHDHNLQVMKPVNGVHYFVSGGGANAHSVRWRENTAFAYAGTGFMWCRLTRDKLLVIVYNRQGDERWIQEIERQ